MRKYFFIFLLLISFLMCYGVLVRKENSPKEITFWTLQMSDFDDYIYKIIRNYENNHPNTHIKWIDVPFSEGEKRTLAAIMSDNPPDLINLNPDFSAILAQKGTLEMIPETALESFNKEIVNTLKYNDVVYSIPWYATSAVTIYNKQLFEKSKILRLPKTYNELSAIANKIKTETGAYAFLPTITENDTMVKILNKYGISKIDEYNSTKSIEVFKMFQNLYDNQLIPKESLTFTHREALEQYMAGKIVFFQGGANFLKIIEENAPTIYEQTDITEQLKGDVGQNDLSIMNFVIPKRAKHKKEALEFCLYLTNEQNQLELARRTNIIATNSSALNNEFYKDKTSLEAKARHISAKQLDNISPQLKQQRSQKEINTLVNTTVQEILLHKDSIENALYKLNKKLKLISKK